MTRNVRDANLETRTARSRLKAQTKPYYRAIDEGLHIGYRKGKAAGKWVMRCYAGAGKYQLETIGSADDTIDADGATFLSFAQAQALARTRFVESRRVAAGLPAESGPYTVKRCMDDYLAWLDQERKSGKDARQKAEALILPTLGDLECSKLTTKRLRQWRDEIAETPARLRTKKGEAQRFREVDAAENPEDVQRRRRATANRVLTILKAALNQAWREQKIGSDQAWRPLAPFQQADSARVRYLTIDEARRLINATEVHFRPMIRAALLTGCRYGELCAFNVADFHEACAKNGSLSATLHVRSSKSGKARHVVLTDEGREFFAGITAGRPARAPLLARPDGDRWKTSQQARPVAMACEHARLDSPASFHTLRHTYASLAIQNGAPLIVVAHNLGHADTRMVEKHYGHLSESYVATAIRAAVPRFGGETRNVTALAEMQTRG